VPADEPRDGLWRRYRRLQRNQIYDGVLTGLCLSLVFTGFQPFHDAAVNLAAGLSLPVILGLIGWHNQRADRRAEQA
jgi:hypothetical protein